MNNISFTSDQFGQLFPYFICIHENGVIESCGSNISQLCGEIIDKRLSDVFTIIRRPEETNEFNVDSFPVNDIVIMHSIINELIYFKGKFQNIIHTGKLIFFGEPCYITRFDEISVLVKSLYNHKDGRLLQSEINSLGVYHDDILNVIQQFDNAEKANKDFKELNHKDLFQESNIDENFAITISDVQGKIQWCNANFLQFTGYSYDEVSGKRPRDVMYGKRSVFIDKDFVDKNIQKGKPFYFENIGYTKTGTEYWFGVTVQPIFNKKNEIIGRFHFIKDISTIKLKEQKNEENENLLKLSLEAAVAGSWSYDLITGEIQISELFKKITNLKWKVEKAFTLNDFKYILHPEDSSHFPDELINSVDPSNPSFDFVYRILVNGNYRYFNTKGNCTKWSSNGLPVRLIGMLVDINDQKELTMKMEQQKQFYEQILNKIPSDIVVFSKEHRYMFVNPVAIRNETFRKWIIGKTDEEYCIYRNRGLEIAEQRRKVFNQAFLSKKQQVWEEKFIKEDGTVLYILRNMYPVLDSNGQVEIVIGYGVDITEMKNAQEQIRLSESRYRSIFDKSLALICIHDLDGNILDVNNSSVRTLGYEAGELIGKNLSDLLPENRRADFDREYMSEINSNGAADGIMVALQKSGKKIYLLYQNYLVDAEQGKPYVIAFSQDITSRINAERALKKSEEKYRNIIADMNLGLMEVDEYENIVYANNSFCEMSGYHINELSGKGISSIFGMDDYYNLKENSLNQKLLGHSEAIELQVRNKLGELKWWLISGAQIFDESGRFKGWIAIHLDITRHKKLEKDLIEAKSAAEHSAKSKEVFLANISHEIRTPMNAVIGIGRLLGKTNLETQQEFYLNTILTAANNLLVIINDLLDFSKIEAGKLTLEKIEFNLSELLKNAFQIIKPKAEEKGLLLKSEQTDQISPVLIGDPYRINQILLNLLSNSVKFTEKGEICVKCSVLSDDKDSQIIRFILSDTGIGMNEEFIKEIFDKFSQEDESVTRKYGGTGLGMSITKQLVDLMGGTISIESRKNAGTTITFSIKFLKSSQSQMPVEGDLVVNYSLLNGKRILLVDDNDFNRLLIDKILSNYGVVTVEAENGNIAIEKMEGDAFDLILMDVQMPEKDGIEASKEIRNKGNAKIPIIAITANAFKTEEERCLNAGMNDYISKPFTEEGILAIIVKWLEHSEKM